MANTVVRLKSIQSGVSDWIAACEDRVNLIDGYLNRVVKADYIATQRSRFEAQNVGDDFGGGSWASLDSSYASYKRRKFEAYPGAGTKINVATSNLLQSLTLSDSYYPSPVPKRIRAGRGGKASGGESAAGSLAVVDNQSIHIYTMVPYAQYVDEVRTFTTWSQIFWDRINRGIMNYLAGKDV